MEKISWLKILVLSLAVVMAGYFVGNMHKNAAEYKRSVTVKGLSEREVDADLAVWPINISLAGNDLTILKNKIESQKKQVYQFFKNQGFDEEELTMGTTNISDAKADRYGGNTTLMAYRYFAKTEFTVRTNDIKKLQKALESSLDLIAMGIILESKNTWRPIEYSFSGLNDLKPAMIEEATMNARQVAEKFAKDSNSEVGKIMGAQQGMFSISDRDQNTPYIKTVRVVSTLRYQLKD
jgi:hypothetical protein